jgi:hypothetical protein
MTIWLVGIQLHYMLIHKTELDCGMRTFFYVFAMHKYTELAFSSTI